MIIKKNYLYSVSLLFFFIAASGIYLMVTNSLLNSILSLIILALGAATVVKYDLTHPYVWYSIFFSLYSIGYPLTVYLDANPIDYGVSKELFVLHWLALVTFLVIVSPKKVSLRTEFKQSSWNIGKYTYTVLSAFLLFFIVYLSTAGYDSKNELGSSESIVAFLGMRIILVFILVSVMNILKSIMNNNKINYKQIIFSFLIISLVVLYTAERDLLLRYILALFFIYYIFLYEKKHKVKLGIFITGMITLVPLSKSFKYVGMRGEIQPLSGNFIVEFISSEFHTQARNVQLLLNNPQYEGFFKGKTIISSFTNLLGLTDFSPVMWFHNTFYPTSSTGMGLSLVGEGYLNLGYLGVVIVFIIIGMVVRGTYRNSDKSIYNLILYLMLIPISIYALRADLNNFLSQYIKQVVLMVFLFKFLNELINRNRKKLNIKTLHT